MAVNQTHIVIMAGGIGSRLWPASTPDRPKQFSDLLGTGKSLIRLTVDRFRPVCPPEHIWVVTSVRYAETVRAQLPEVPAGQILCEPEPRNTAPCIAYACRKIEAVCPDACVVVTPSDALILDPAAFAEAVLRAVAFSEKRSAIVTLGIPPLYPATGYGYIQAGDMQEEPFRKVSSFREKPDAETARRYLEAGGYYWNAGIFIWHVSTVLGEIRRHAPQIASVMDELAPFLGTAGEAEALSRLFPTCENISIDYAVMERSDKIWVLPAPGLGWSDLGNWTAVQAQQPADGQGNAAVGPVRFQEASGCYVHAPGLRDVVVAGVEGLLVAEEDGRLLVCPLSREQQVREWSRKKD